MRKVATLGLTLGLLLAGAALSGGSKARNLKPGDMAPAIDVDTWYKGGPIESLQPGKLYVVDFWATWCVPCRNEIPKLSKLAAKYKGKVTFIGVAIWEKGNNIPAQIKQVVKNMGPKMAYNVAGDDNGAMAKSWMAAAGINYIPRLFVIDRQGRVAWFGAPTAPGFPYALEHLTAGDYNIQAAMKMTPQQKTEEMDKDGNAGPGQ
jgi:thiol-disulfide isomerase/thioredoxin